MVREGRSTSWVWWVVGIVGLATLCVVGPFVLLIGLGMFAAATSRPEPYDPYGSTSLPPPIDPNIAPVPIDPNTPTDPSNPQTPPSPGDITLTPLGPPATDPNGNVPPLGDSVPDDTLPPDGITSERVEVPVTVAQPARGPRDALVTIVAFSDFQCPFCSRVEPTLAQVRERYGADVRIVWRNNPLPFHQNAMPAAEAALEARAQGGEDKFWQMHDLLFANQHALERADLTTYANQVGLDQGRFQRALASGTHRTAIQADMALAQRLGANGTPSFFINGVALTGAQPVEAFSRVIDQELVVARALVARGTTRDQVYDSLMMLARARSLVGTGSGGAADTLRNRRHTDPLGDL